MSKEDTSAGLLSKVVKFVRNPATSWSDLDNKSVDRDEALSKQLLKEMIERKRRNDFVRKREFDMLRKMRKREAMIGQDPSARPSFFQSSLPSKPDDRARTIKKIDEIEAQMSMQWWKTKHGNSALGSAGTPFDPSASTPVGSELPPDSTPFLEQPRSFSYASTEPAGLQHLGQPAGGGLAGAAPGFVATNVMSTNVAEVAHDAELEEAAIRFANGDDAGAEAGLRDMLSPGGSRVAHPETWMALFDLYRASGQQDRFEVAAIDFIRRFDRSAPQWYSMPDIVEQMTRSVAKVEGNASARDWICPSVAGIQTVAALKAALEKSPMPWRLDWSNLKTIDAAAVEPLYRVFADWSGRAVQLRFMNSANLRQVLQNATPSGRRETPQASWLLRMEELRVEHRADEFELVALDFCVTYEVSPPAWANALCKVKTLDAEGGSSTSHTIIGEVSRDSMLSVPSTLGGDTQMDGLSSFQSAHIASIELSGQIRGDVMDVMDQIEAKLIGADIMVISCAKLIRVDFSAAGTLLNWVSARHLENRQVQFTEVNRLVAAFFNLIGITEYARVSLRAD